MKAHIEKIKGGKGLWLILDDKTKYAITEDEVEAIRDACDAWLGERE